MSVDDDQAGFGQLAAELARKIARDRLVGVHEERTPRLHAPVGEHDPLQVIVALEALHGRIVDADHGAPCATGR